MAKSKKQMIAVNEDQLRRIDDLFFSEKKRDTDLFNEVASILFEIPKEAVTHMQMAAAKRFWVQRYLESKPEPRL